MDTVFEPCWYSVADGGGDEGDSAATSIRSGAGASAGGVTAAAATRALPTSAAEVRHATMLCKRLFLDLRDQGPGALLRGGDGHGNIDPQVALQVANATDAVFRGVEWPALGAAHMLSPDESRTVGVLLAWQAISALQAVQLKPLQAVAKLGTVCVFRAAAMALFHGHKLPVHDIRDKLAHRRRTSARVPHTLGQERLSLGSVRFLGEGGYVARPFTATTPLLDVLYCDVRFVLPRSHSWRLCAPRLPDMRPPACVVGLAAHKDAAVMNPEQPLAELLMEEAVCSALDTLFEFIHAIEFASQRQQQSTAQQAGAGVGVGAGGGGGDAGGVKDYLVRNPDALFAPPPTTIQGGSGGSDTDSDSDTADSDGESGSGDSRTPSAEAVALSVEDGVDPLRALPFQLKPESALSGPLLRQGFATRILNDIGASFVRVASRDTASRRRSSLGGLSKAVVDDARHAADATAAGEALSSVIDALKKLQEQDYECLNRLHNEMLAVNAHVGSKSVGRFMLLTSGFMPRLSIQYVVASLSRCLEPWPRH